MQHKEQFTPQQALPKAKHYCAYQERCHAEVKDKLYSFGLNKNEVAQIISTLIEENYLNEERFAIMYAGGHFRTKQWGRIKIKYELKKKQISDYCIQQALAAIDDKEYIKTFSKLTTLKLDSLKNEKNLFLKKRKLQEHLRMKGYEPYLINDALSEIEK
jgi:regulatory protein